MNLQIHADQITAHMPPTFHGLMTEEINYAFEGGLYAELIRNRNFKETVPARTNRQNPDQSTPAKEAKDLVDGAPKAVPSNGFTCTLIVAPLVTPNAGLDRLSESASRT